MWAWSGAVIKYIFKQMKNGFGMSIANYRLSSYMCALGADPVYNDYTNTGDCCRAPVAARMSLRLVPTGVIRERITLTLMATRLSDVCLTQHFEVKIPEVMCAPSNCIQDILSDNLNKFVTV